MSVTPYYNLPAGWPPLPCTPLQLRLPVNFQAPGLLPSENAVEAALRLLWESVNNGNWVGVALSYLWNAAVDEAETYAAAIAHGQRNDAAQTKYRKARRRYITGCVLTFGLGALRRRPVKPTLTEPNIPKPTGVALEGADFLVAGLDQLGRSNLIMLANVAHDPEERVIYAMPELIAWAHKHFAAK